MEWKIRKLANGVRLVAVPMPHMQSAALGIWAGVGSRHEPAGLNGISHFLEHLLFKGTGRRSPRQISSAIEGVGGWLNACTGEESTCYYAKAEARHLPRLADVLTDLFLRSTLPPAEVEREREVIIEEIAMYGDLPSQVAQDLLNRLLWPRHALGRPITGTASSISTIGRAALETFYRERYGGAATVAVAAGNLAADTALDLMEGHLKDLPRGQGTRTRRPAESDRPHIAVREMDAEQCQLAVGFRIPGRNDERRYAFRLLSVVLGGNMSSRLFQNLRERCGLCYSVHSGVELFADAGTFTIHAGLDKKNLPRSLRLIGSELARVAGSPVGARELRAAKDYAIGQMRMGLESTTNCMVWTGESLLGHGRILAPAEIEARITEVSAEEIRELARTFFHHKNLASGCVGRGVSQEQMATCLSNW